jgi:hypothetical protein
MDEIFSLPQALTIHSSGKNDKTARNETRLFIVINFADSWYEGTKKHDVRHTKFHQATGGRHE